jgi:hypothetical protein
MGLFSSKKKTIVGTTVSRAIEDNMLPDSLKAGVLSALMNDDPQITEHILDCMMSNTGVKAEQMYRWAKDNYIHGLPQATFLTTADANAVAKDIIETNEGRTVDIAYSQMKAFNPFHYGFSTLVSTYGFNQQTNTLATLTTEKGSTVYLVDMVLVVQEASLEELTTGALENWDIPPNSGVTPKRPVQRSVSQNVTKASPINVDPNIPNDFLRVTYCWVTGTGKDKIYNEDHFDIQIVRTAEEDEKEYVQVKYYWTTTITPPNELFNIPGVYETTYKYFTYEIGTGVYPEIDAVFTPEYNGLGSFFPWLYFRYDKVNQTTNKTTENYRDTKKLCKFLNIPLDTVADAVDENPDIDDVEQAMFIMAVPAETQDQLEMRYLYDFFKKAYLETGSAGIGDITDPLLLIKSSQSKTCGIMIQDNRFKMNLRFRSIRSIKKAGKLVTEYETGTFDVTRDVSTALFGDTQTGIFNHTEKVSCHYYRKQISESIYEEIQVYGLEMSYYVSGAYAATSDSNKKILLVPIDYSITKTYSSLNAEVLYARSFHYVFNSKVVIKIKWYQQGWFGDLIKIAAIVWTIVSLGSDGGSALQLALAAGEYPLAAAIILKQILISIIIRVAFKFVAKILGPEFALILSVAILAYGAYEHFSSGVEGAPWAKQLLKTATGLAQGASDNITEALMGLQDEAKAFGLAAHDKMELLEEAYKLLDTNSNLAPFIVFGESPSDFYTRTVHSGNIGVYSLDAVTNYVDLALQLPKPHKSLVAEEPQAV